MVTIEKTFNLRNFGNIISRIQRKVEEKETINEQMYKQEIQEVNFEDGRHSMRITDIVKDALKDIQNRQNGILDARGYSYDRIEQINEHINAYIRDFEMRQGDNIRYSIEEDKKELISQVMKEYEEYIQYDKSEEEKKEQSKDEKEEFKEGLNAGISLEEQHEFVEKRINKEQVEQNKESEREDLPGDVIL